MAHMIESEDVVLTAIGDSRAWHGLDKQVDFQTFDWIREAFGYRVDVKNLHTALGALDAYGLISERAPSKLLRLCPSDAVVDQPSDVARFAERLNSSVGGRIVSALTLEHTARLAICIELSDTICDLGNGDRISKYVVVTGSYDGSHPWRVQFWTMRAVCNNTLPSATMEDGYIWSARNGKGERFSMQLADKIAGIIRAIPAERMRKENDIYAGLTTAAIDPLRDVNRFAQLIAEDGGKVLNRIIQLDPDMRGASLLDRCLVATIDQSAWMSVRAADMSPLGRKIVVNTLEGMGSDLGTARNTAWGLLNAATQSFDHDSKRERQDQLSSQMFQEFRGEKQNALLLASALANTSW